MPLKIVKRPKSPYWYIRGTVAGTSVEESTRTADRDRAEYLKTKREKELLDRHVYGAKKTATFAEAIVSYVLAGGEKRFLKPLLNHFGERPLSEITQADIEAAAQALYPGASAATHNRQVYTPMITLLRRAAMAQLCDPVLIVRPKVRRKPVHIPADDWWSKIEPQCSPNLWALLVFLANTGSRVSEALRLKWSDLDRARNKALLGRTKNGEPREVTINTAVWAALDAKKEWEGKDGNSRFRTGALFNFSGRTNVYRSIKSACARAGVPYYPTHSAGRHTFASRGLKAGWSLKLLKEAGGWKTIAVPAQNYGHLEQNAIHDAILALGENPGTKRRKTK